MERRTLWAINLWKVLGLLVFIGYAVVTAALLLCLIYDAAQKPVSSTYLSFDIVRGSALNSAAIAIPAAAASITGGFLLGYRLCFLSRTGVIFSITILMLPFFSSPIALYLGIKAVIGGGPQAFVTGLVFRYLPICSLAFLVSLQRIAPESRATLRNLRISESDFVRLVIIPLAAPTAGLLFVVLTLLMPLDVIGSTVAGNGTMQTFGNLIETYCKTQDAQQTASQLTLGFLILAATVLVALSVAGSRQPSRLVATRGNGATEAESARAALSNPIFVAYFCGYAAILLGLISEGRASNAQYDELLNGLATSMYIIVPMTIMTATSSLFIGSWLHLTDIRQESLGGRFIASTLVVGVLLPPLLAGRMAAVVQGILGRAGGEVELGGWYLYFFGSIPILVLMGHPLLFDRVLPKVAANHRLRVDDYVFSVFFPGLRGAILVGASLFFAIALSDAVIARYVAASTKTLGLVLANHQAGALSSGDYFFMGGLGLWTLLLLLLAGFVMSFTRRRAVGANNVRYFSGDSVNPRS